MHNIHNQQFTITLWYSITLPQSYSDIRILSIVFQSYELTGEKNDNMRTHFSIVVEKIRCVQNGVHTSSHGSCNF